MAANALAATTTSRRHRTAPRYRLAVPTPGPALPADQRPVDRTPVDTAQLPPTPVRDRNIPAGAWRQAPARLLELGADLSNDDPANDPAPDPAGPEAMYKRRLGDWLLWRAGPASRGHARYLAVRAEDLTDMCEFRIFPDGTGEGAGPSGTVHTRFREWKQDLHGA
jgi:hypothetical protein